MENALDIYFFSNKSVHNTFSVNKETIPIGIKVWNRYFTHDTISYMH